jgi:hypothetical protein
MSLLGAYACAFYHECDRPMQCSDEYRLTCAQQLDTLATWQVEAAKVAAHPFTTIDPNVATGWACVADPGVTLGVGEVAHGRHGSTRWGRRVPVVVKDVAGLVRVNPIA